MPASTELTLQSNDVEILEQAEPQGVVDLIESADNRLRESLFDEFSAGHGVTSPPVRPLTVRKCGEANPFVAWAARGNIHIDQIG
jgi:hypothetical protein